MSTTDKWIYFDWICLLLILATIVTNAMFVIEDDAIWKRINDMTSILMLLILWLRMFKYARPFENAGLPFSLLQSFYGIAIRPYTAKNATDLMQVVDFTDLMQVANKLYQAC